MVALPQPATASAPAAPIIRVTGAGRASETRDALVRRTRYAVAKAALAAQLGGRVNLPGRVTPLEQQPPPPPPSSSSSSPSSRPSLSPEDFEHTVLVEAEATQACTFHKVPGAQLKMRLQVYTLHRPLFHTYLGYYAYISLRRPGATDFDEIGNICTWRLSKPAKHSPNVNGVLWRQDWLGGSAGDIKYPNGTDSFAKALRAIYNYNGTVRTRVGQPFRAQFANNATGNDLVYIQQLFIKMQNADGTVQVSYWPLQDDPLIPDKCLGRVPRKVPN